MAALLQRVRLLDGTALDGATAFALGTASAAGILGLRAGRIEAGASGDLVAIDLDHLSLQPRSDLLRSIVFAMSPQAVTDVWVEGHRVVKSGRLTGVDARDLATQVREVVAEFAR